MHIRTSPQASLGLGLGDYSCNWGTHLCGLFEGADDRDAIAMPFLARGVVDGDLQLAAVTDRTPDEFRRILCAHHPECAARAGDPEHFRVFRSRDVYWPDGRFETEQLARRWEQVHQDTQRHGRRNIRVAAEIGDLPSLDKLIEYESWVNHFIEGKPWTAICLFDLNKCSGSVIMGVLRTHPWVLSGGVITENPYYQKPDAWLAGGAHT